MSSNVGVRIHYLECHCARGHNADVSEVDLVHHIGHLPFQLVQLSLLPISLEIQLLSFEIQFELLVFDLKELSWELGEWRVVDHLVQMVRTSPLLLRTHVDRLSGLRLYSEAFWSRFVNADLASWRQFSVLRFAIFALLSFQPAPSCGIHLSP